MALYGPGGHPAVSDSNDISMNSLHSRLANSIAARKLDLELDPFRDAQCAMQVDAKTSSPILPPSPCIRTALTLESYQRLECPCPSAPGWSDLRAFGLTCGQQRQRLPYLKKGPNGSRQTVQMSTVTQQPDFQINRPIIMTGSNKDAPCKVGLNQAFRQPGHAAAVSGPDTQRACHRIFIDRLKTRPKFQALKHRVKVLADRRGVTKAQKWQLHVVVLKSKNRAAVRIRFANRHKLVLPNRDAFAVRLGIAWPRIGDDKVNVAVLQIL